MASSAASNNTGSATDRLPRTWDARFPPALSGASVRNHPVFLWRAEACEKFCRMVPSKPVDLSTFDIPPAPANVTVPDYVLTAPALNHYLRYVTNVPLDMTPFEVLRRLGIVWYGGCEGEQTAPHPREAPTRSHNLTIHPIEHATIIDMFPSGATIGYDFKYVRATDASVFGTNKMQPSKCGPVENLGMRRQGCAEYVLQAVPYGGNGAPDDVSSLVLIDGQQVALMGQYLHIGQRLQRHESASSHPLTFAVRESTKAPLIEVRLAPHLQFL